MNRHTYNVLTRLRDIHFMEACRKARCRASGQITTASIAADAASMPAPCYYVSPIHAIRTLSRYRRHGRLPGAGRPSGAMWRELIDRVDRLRSRRRYLSDRQALMRILTDGHASSFFLAPSTALRLYHSLKSS